VRSREEESRAFYKERHLAHDNQPGPRQEGTGRHQNDGTIRPPSATTITELTKNPTMSGQQEQIGDSRGKKALWAVRGADERTPAKPGRNCLRISLRVGRKIRTKTLAIPNGKNRHPSNRYIHLPMCPSKTKPLRPKSVTHVLGTLCHPCLRAGPRRFWSRGRDLNPRPADYESAALPTELPRLDSATHIITAADLSQFANSQTFLQRARIFCLCALRPDPPRGRRHSQVNKVRG
jgi:hypothetical protein